MVELFTVGCFGRTPDVIIRPVAYVTAHKLPTAAEVERTCKPINGPGPNPLVGFVGTFQLTRSSITAGPYVTRRVPIAQPPSEPVWNEWDRDRRLTQDGHYLRKPPSNRTSTSPCIRLYVPPT